MKNFQFSKYCTPAQLYLILGAIGIIGAFFNNYSIETLLTQALFLVIWAWVLNWLCSKGFKAISWILVLLPFIMALFTYFFIKDVLVVREGCDNNPGPARDQCLKFDAEIAAAQAAAEKRRQEQVAKVAKAAAAAAFEAENKRRQEAMKQQQQALAAMQAASAAAINN